MEDRIQRLDRQKIVFVCGADFNAPSEKIALGFGLELVERGHQVMIAIRGDADSIRMEIEGELPEGLSVFPYSFRGRRIPADQVRKAREFEPTIVHVYNPRLPVVKAARQMFGDELPMVMNFEDDEWGLKSFSGGGPRRGLAKLAGRAGSIFYPPAWPYATRGTMEWCAEKPREIHAITPELAREVGIRIERDATVLPPVHPGMDRIPAEPTVPAALGKAGERPVVAFTGAVFSPQMSDFRLLVEAVGMINKRGLDVVFVFAGSIAGRFDLAAWTREAGINPDGFIDLGYLSSDEMWGLLKRADLLAQPGRNTEFNRLRLPSKLQAYLASATPTITFACGAGEFFEDRSEVLKTYGDGSAELADRIVELLEDEGLRSTLSENGPKAASRLFDAHRNTDILVGIYAAALGVQPDHDSNHG